jgi:hypothetical protein
MEDIEKAAIYFRDNGRCLHSYTLFIWKNCIILKEILRSTPLNTISELIKDCQEDHRTQKPIYQPKPKTPKEILY